MKEFCSHDKKSVDLYILSDGTNPSMEGYTRSNKDKIPYVGRWSFKLLRYFGIAATLLGLTAIVYACYLENRTVIILLTIAGTLGILMAFVFFLLSRGIVGLSKRAGIPSFFSNRLFHVDKLKLDLNCLYKVAINGKKLKTPDFQLPASKNTFTTGDFHVTLEKSKQTTKETAAEFKCTYTGKEIGLVNSAQLSVKLKDGQEFANNGSKDKIEILRPGDLSKIYKHTR